MEAESVNSGLTDMVNLASLLVLGISCLYFLCTGIIGLPSLPGIYLGAGDLNTGPHSCTPTALPMEPSPQSPKLTCLKGGSGFSDGQGLSYAHSCRAGILARSSDASLHFNLIVSGPWDEIG